MRLPHAIRKIAFLGLSVMLLTGTGDAFEGVQMKQVATDFTAVAKAAIPAVVSIRVKESKKSTSSKGTLEDFSDDSEEQLFQKFFGHKTPTEPREGQGSGFVVTADGFIITNGHVVTDMSEIVVQLHDGREFPAKVIGQDSNTDIALIKIDATDLSFLKLGNSDAIEVGEWVVAIGTPMGLEASLTTGVVSAKGRNNLSLARVEDFIQTDAALYHGNSGGPLLNLSAEVIGINTAIASQMGGSIGIGFAIPSNIAKNVMDQLRSKGSVSRGFIGVLLQDINQDLASAFGLSKSEGALIAQVSKGSPAEKAGIQQGDVIMAYNKLPVANTSALRTAIALMLPGTALELSIVRDNKPQKITLEVGEYAAEAAAEAPVAAPESEHKELGVTVGTLTPEMARKLGDDGEKVVVTAVEPGSLAQQAGLRKGALIVSVNQKKVDSLEAYQQLIKSADTTKPFLFLVKEGQGMRFISFKAS